MLNLAKCVVKQASSYNVDSTLNRLEEGVALVAKMENGVTVATVATGVADEQFLGVSQNRHTMPESAVREDIGAVPGTAPYTFPLGRAVFNNEIAIYIAGSIADRILTGTPAAGEYLVDANGLVTFAAADAGKDISFRFRYSLTQNEANMLFGSDLVSFVRLPDVSTSAIEVGLVVTDNYVLEDDWSNAKVAYLGAGGKFTTDDTGSVAGRVAGLPSAFEGFLAVEISV